MLGMMRRIIRLSPLGAPESSPGQAQRSPGYRAMSARAPEGRQTCRQSKAVVSLLRLVRFYPS